MNCSRGNMGSIQREIRASMQREDEPTMETGLERIAAKARSEPKLRFTSLAHHITRERVWTNLCQIPKRSAPGVHGQTVTEAKETFGEWVEPVLRSVHRQGYRAPDIRRVYIPKPGKRDIHAPDVRCPISLAVNGPEHRLYPFPEGLLCLSHGLAVHPWSRALRNLTQIRPYSFSCDVMGQGSEP